MGVAHKPDFPIGRVRARTLSAKRVSKRALARAGRLYPETELPRPHTRVDCLQGPNAERPCPFVSCRHHLYLDITSKGNLKLNFPDQDPWDLAETCSLDIADRGGESLVQVGRVMNLTRERVRQLEAVALVHAGEQIRAEPLRWDMADTTHQAVHVDRPDDGWTVLQGGW